jgi:hypothetical protein
MESDARNTEGILSRVLAGARSLAARLDDRMQAALETAEETNARRAGMPTYSRQNPNPAWGGYRPGPGDRVVGRQVVSEGGRPFGQTILGAAAEMEFGRVFAPEPSNASAEIGADFFAARQSLADRRLR